jgi:putative DNA primase/helicase
LRPHIETSETGRRIRSGLVGETPMTDGIPGAPDVPEWDNEWHEEPPEEWSGEPAPTQTKRRSPNGYFHPDTGLMTDRLIGDVMQYGPLRYGEDGTFWYYENGVYKPDKGLLHVRSRFTDLLRDRYRVAHERDGRAYLSTQLDVITADPIENMINMHDCHVDWTTENGTSTVEHSPDVPSTVQLPVRWNPWATCDAFDTFLSQVLHEDDVPRMWEIIGYAMVSSNRLQRMFLFSGTGQNGKGALLRTIQKLIGRGNYSSVPMHELSSDRYAAADLHGKLANICGDIDATYIENTGLLKQVSGGDTIRAQRKYGQPFEFEPWCSFFYSANEIPRSADSTIGFSRRFEVIDFARYVEKDPAVEPAIQSADSLEGIAVKAIGALRDLMARGDFMSTESGRNAKREFDGRSNPVKRWLSDCAFPAEDGFETRKALWTSYMDWEKDQRLRPIMQETFYSRLRQMGDRGVHEHKRTGMRGFKGIYLNERQRAAPRGWEPPPPDEEEPPPLTLFE